MSNAKNCPTARVVGLNSGTSVDSIDVALVEFNELEPHVTTFKVLEYQEYPFDGSLRQQVFDACSGRNSIVELCELNFWLGEVFGRAAQRLLGKANLGEGAVDLIASHGETIYHQMEAGHRQATLQFGEAALIAAQTGLTVASNFRVADVAVGGQGAPLVSYFDYLFFRDALQGRAILNLGGIANISYLPSAKQGGIAYAFDTGPGNMLIDYAVQHYSRGALAFDKDGAMARAGQVNSELLAELMTNHFLREKPPKSTGRENFGDAFGKELIWACEQRDIAPNDVVATLTAFTVQSIARAHRTFGPRGGIRELVVSGGGTYNPVLMDSLNEIFPGVVVSSHDEFGVSAGSKEAVTFALLGYELLRGRAANLPGCTGAKSLCLLGELTPGQNYTRLLQKFVPYMHDIQDQTTQIGTDTNNDNGNEEQRWQPQRKLILSK